MPNCLDCIYFFRHPEHIIGACVIEDEAEWKKETDCTCSNFTQSEEAWNDVMWDYYLEENDSARYPLPLTDENGEPISGWKKG